MKHPYILSLILLGAAASGCAQDSPVTDRTGQTEQEEYVNPAGTFACGADVSWLTQMEKEGYTFTTPEGERKECMRLLRDDCGVNAIRLRVWVNPADGWCNADDVIYKARRAHSLGLRLMIDFHFSDIWADPGAQVTPAEWAGYDIEQLKWAVGQHVTEVMTRLDQYGITPEWAQIGNETRNGMLYPLGNVGDYPANFAALVSTGTAAVHAIFPECKCIVHVDQGQTWARYTRIFDVLKARGADYDMIGISIYPETTGYMATLESAMANCRKARETYGKPVMVCEVGMAADAVAQSTEMMRYLAGEGRQSCEGVFYWEPQAPMGYNGGYNKGCFLNGAPTSALSPFKD